MKGSCLLICLVLPQAILGSIFASDAQNSDLKKSLDFIDRYDEEPMIHSKQTEIEQNNKEPESQIFLGNNHEDPIDQNQNKPVYSIPQIPQYSQENWYEPMHSQSMHNQQRMYWNSQHEEFDMKKRQKSPTPMYFENNADQHEYNVQREQMLRQKHHDDYERTQPRYIDSNDEKRYAEKTNSLEQRYTKPNQKMLQSDEHRDYDEYAYPRLYNTQNAYSTKHMSGENYNQKSNSRKTKTKGKKDYYTTNKNDSKNRYTRSEMTRENSEEQQEWNRNSEVSKLTEEHTEPQQPSPLNEQQYRTMYAFRKNILIPFHGKAVVYRDMVRQPIPVKFSNMYDEEQKDASYDMMQTVSKEEKVKFYEEYDNAKNRKEMRYNTTELLMSNGRLVEAFTVQTDDGYLLTLYRITPQLKTREVKRRPAVLMLHGLFGSSDDWVLMGPNKSLAYILSDAGYDVYLGNVRGNKYSRRHVTKHPALPDFWQYNNDDIALHDLPAMIDYVLKKSQQQKIFFVGFSQANSHFLALAARHPEYNNKIISMHALSPMVYMSNSRSPFVKLIAPNSPYYERLWRENGEFHPSTEMMQAAGSANCHNMIGCDHVCSNIYFILNGFNMHQMNGEITAAVVNHHTSSVSTRQVQQLGQAYAAMAFQMYDYGSRMNTKVYGDSQPLKYDLKSVTVPIVLYYSEEDWLASPKDVKMLENELPNVKKSYNVSEQHFSNLDFLFGKDAPEVVYQRLVQMMDQTLATY